MRAERVVLPRTVLRITSWRDTEAFRGALTTAPLKGEWWVATHELLGIHAAPDAEPVVNLHPPEPQALPLVVVNKTTRAWWRVQQVLGDGSAIHGWVNVKDIRPWNPDAPVQGQVERPTAPEAIGCDNAFLTRNEGPRVRARLVVGSSVYTKPHGEPWATIARPAEVEAVLLPSDQAWARIKHVPDLTVDCELGLFVAKTNLVVLPEKKRQRPTLASLPCQRDRFRIER